MTYQVYAFAPDAELMDELDELDEAIARCEELVHEDGYPVAEVWDSAGDRVHSIGRSGEWTRAASRPDAAAASEAAPGFGYAEESAAREPDPDAPDPDAPDPDTTPVDDGRTSASSDASAAHRTHEQPSPEPATATVPSPAADGAPRNAGPRSVIGNAAAASVQWFGT